LEKVFDSGFIVPVNIKIVTNNETKKTFNHSNKVKCKQEIINFYSVFQGFSKAKSANGGSILSSSQFLILPQLPQKIKFASKVVEVDSKIIISLPKI
jgi:hypothetical protein